MLIVNQQPEAKILYSCGPGLLSVRGAIHEVGRAFGRDIKVREVDEAQ
jgi:hypothetical protein